MLEIQLKSLSQFNYTLGTKKTPVEFRKCLSSQDIFPPVICYNYVQKKYKQNE